MLLKTAAMSVLGRLIAMIEFPAPSTDPRMIRELLTGMAAFIASVVICGLMIGVLLIGLLYAGYAALLEAGLSQPASMAVVGFIAAVITATLVAVTLARVRNLSILPRLLTQTSRPANSNLVGHATGIVDAFMQGFLNSNINDKTRKIP